jgi:RNA polymerase sigma factor (sigma-70 family)
MREAPVSTSPPEPSTEELIVQFRAGQRAFSQLLGRYDQELIEFGRRAFGQNAHVGGSDIVQDAHHHLVEKLGLDFQGNTEGEFVAWLKKAIRNRAYNTRRDQGRKKRAPRKDKSRKQDSVSDPASIVRRRELDEVIEQLIADFPDRDDRLLLRLRFWYNMMFEEIGSLLDMSEDAVRRRMDRLKEKLATDERLRAEGEDAL